MERKRDYPESLDVNGNFPRIDEPESKLANILGAIGLVGFSAVYISLAVLNKAVQETRRAYHSARGRDLERVETDAFFYYRVK